MYKLDVFFILAACALAVQGKSWSKQMENPHLLEGDIVLDPDEMPMPGAHSVFASIKGGKWPNAVLPYVIDSSLGASARKVIDKAIADYQKFTCIRFKKRTRESAYLKFYKGKGCSSLIGYRAGRVNHVSLGPGCLYKGIVMHEIGHSLGFYHEQSRPDRDRYVTIVWKNIEEKMKFNFNKMSKSKSDITTPYDLKSMMHYGSTSFGNGKTTIITKDLSKKNLIGQRTGFSVLDRKQLNQRYCA